MSNDKKMEQEMDDIISVQCIFLGYDSLRVVAANELRLR